MRDQSASGAGPAADDHGNIYFAANGTFDTTIDAKVPQLWRLWQLFPKALYEQQDAGGC
jgi:hypothetical protein